LKQSYNKYPYAEQLHRARETEPETSRGKRNLKWQLCCQSACYCSA